MSLTSKRPQDKWHHIDDFIEAVSSDPAMQEKLSKLVKNHNDILTLRKTDLLQAGVPVKEIRVLRQVLKTDNIDDED